jgi:hypothetical protein
MSWILSTDIFGKAMRSLRVSCLCAICVIGRHDWQVKHDKEGQPYEICGRPRCYHVRGHDSQSDGPYRRQDSDPPLPPQSPPADPGPAAGVW